jgi:hypothetical protein
MECNVGGWDRGARGVVALAGIGTALCPAMSKSLRIVSGILGAMASFTFLSRYCPLNELGGVNTCSPAHKLENSEKNEQKSDHPRARHWGAAQCC